MEDYIKVDVVDEKDLIDSIKKLTSGKITSPLLMYYGDIDVDTLVDIRDTIQGIPTGDVLIDLSNLKIHIKYEDHGSFMNCRFLKAAPQLYGVYNWTAMYRYCENLDTINYVSFDEIEDGSNLFAYTKISDFDFSKTPNLKTGNCMFFGCHFKGTLNLEPLQKLQTADHMFEGCKGEYIKWPVTFPKLKDCFCMFKESYFLEFNEHPVDLSVFDAAESLIETFNRTNVYEIKCKTGLSHLKMFQYAFYSTPLKKVNIMLHNVTQAFYAFANCTQLKQALICLPAAENLSSMFERCENLKKIDMCGTSKNLKFLSRFASGCEKLQEIVNIEFSNVEIMYGAFQDCHSIKDWSFLGNLGKVREMDWAFAKSTIKELDLSKNMYLNSIQNSFRDSTLEKLSLPPICLLTGLYDESSLYACGISKKSAPCLKEISCYGVFNISRLIDPALKESCKINELSLQMDWMTFTHFIKEAPHNKPENPYYIDIKYFPDNFVYEELISTIRQSPVYIDLSPTVVPYVPGATFDGLFSHCVQMVGCPFISQEIPSADYMFSYCRNLVHVHSECFKHCKSMANCFNECTHLETIDNGNFGACDNFQGTFLDCKSLRMNSFPFPLESNCMHMFAGCSSLKDFTIFSTTCLNMYKMFSDCENLDFVDMSTIGEKSNTECAFNGCTKLKHVEYKEALDVSSAFINCPSYLK